MPVVVAGAEGEDESVGEGILCVPLSSDEWSGVRAAVVGVTVATTAPQHRPVTASPPELEQCTTNRARMTTAAAAAAAPAQQQQ